MNILSELFMTFAKIGSFTFGGGYAMLALLDHECVEKKGWITADEMMDITAIAESTPGPIAINCATYTGYKQRGIRGAIAATTGMVLPSFVIIFIISSFFENLLEYRIVANVFRGIRAAVAFLIIRAAVKMIRKMLKQPAGKNMRIIFVSVFFVIIFTMNLIGVSFSSIYLILAAGAAGFMLYLLRKGGVKT